MLVGRLRRRGGEGLGGGLGEGYEKHSKLDMGEGCI